GFRAHRIISSPDHIISQTNHAEEKTSPCLDAGRGHTLRHDCADTPARLGKCTVFLNPAIARVRQRRPPGQHLSRGMVHMDKRQWYPYNIPRAALSASPVACVRVHWSGIQYV